MIKPIDYLEALDLAASAQGAFSFMCSEAIATTAEAMRTTIQFHYVNGRSRMPECTATYNFYGFAGRGKGVSK